LHEVRLLPLAGRDDFRIRVGDYRIVFAVDDEEKLVLVARIAHRREVYRR
jgi:mRNA interferase RelE/StbE